MAATKLSNIIIPEVFEPYFIEQTAEKSAILSSGVAQRSPLFDSLASGEGTTFQLPFFQDLSGASEILKDDTSATVNNIAAIKDIACRHARIKAWGSSDLVSMLSGADPMRTIADLAATYWARQQQSILVSTLVGIFATTLSSTHVNDIAIEDGANATSTALISGDAVIDTATLLGDAASDLSVIMMHSTVYSRLQKQNLITFVRNSDNEILFATYLGKRVIVDDGCYKVAGGTSGFKYSTYLFAPGAVAFGQGNIKDAVEVDRDSLASTDLLITRSSFIMHPRGVKWTGTATDNFPTNTELETGSNWSKVFETKNVRVVELITNG